MSLARIITIVAVSVALGLPATALAQGRPGGMGTPRYLPSTETAVSGTVTEVQTHQGRMNRTGTHVILDTPAGPLDVHVGPTQWLATQGYTLEKGNALTVVGSRVTIEGKEALLAKTITTGSATYHLRNDQGLPNWAPAHGRRGTR